jgi:hypothetical protein
MHVTIRPDEDGKGKKKKRSPLASFWASIIMSREIINQMRGQEKQKEKRK